VRFAIASTMRRGEILRLRWSDLHGKTILVRDRKHPTEKFGNDQRVPLLREARAIIERQPRTSERIFPYAKATVSAAWANSCKRAGIEGATFHDLRHTGITLLFRMGFQIQQVALMSGHRDWKMLRRYTHITAEDIIHAEVMFGRDQQLVGEFFTGR
jgi:integrase